MGLMDEGLTQALIPLAALLGIGFALFQWFLVSRVKVSGWYGLDNGYKDKLIMDAVEPEEGVDSDDAIAKCAEIQNGISVVTNCAWREDIIDSAFDNPWMDPNTGLLIDLENHLVSESQNEWSDERKLIARLRSMCQPFQEVNPKNRIRMHQLEYNQEAFYDDQSIVGGDEAFEVDGGLTTSQPIGWLAPQIFYDSQMMNFLSENSLYQYDLSQQKVMDYAATGVGHEVDRWW